MVRVNVRIGWVLTVLLGLFVIISGVFTIVGNEQVNLVFEGVNLSSMQISVGVGKIISAVLFLIPATFVIGVLLLSAFWGGALVTHLSLGDGVIVQSLLLILTWVIYALRKPMHFIK